MQASDDILAVMMDADHVRIIPPQESDTEDVKQLKLFLLACLARRSLDKDFNKDMAIWLGGVTEEEFRSRHTTVTKQ